MSARRRSRAISARAERAHAPLFAALGDDHRLGLVKKLSSGASLSISELSADSKVTRQAIRKHLSVLEGAGLVRAERQGTRSLYRLVPEPLVQARGFLEDISHQWDCALERLRAFVEP